MIKDLKSWLKFMDVGMKKYTLMKTLYLTFKHNFPVKWLLISTVSGRIPDWEMILNFCFRKNILKPRTKRIELRNCKEKTLNSEKIITNDIWMQFFNYEFFYIIFVDWWKNKIKKNEFLFERIELHRLLSIHFFHFTWGSSFFFFLDSLNFLHVVRFSIYGDQ